MNLAAVGKLIERAKGAGSIRALAEAWDMDHAYLYRMMTGEREPSEEVLMRLGLERITIYRKRKSKRSADSC